MFRDDMKMFLGLPPYDSPSNICRSDPYFAKELEKKYGIKIEELVKNFNLGEEKTTCIM